MMFFQDYDVITREFPREPPEKCDFSQFRLVMCILITKINVMIPVLLKTSF